MACVWGCISGCRSFFGKGEGEGGGCGPRARRRLGARYSEQCSIIVLLFPNGVVLYYMIKSQGEEKSSLVKVERKRV